MEQPDVHDDVLAEGAEQVLMLVQVFRVIAVAWTLLCLFVGVLGVIRDDNWLWLMGAMGMGVIIVCSRVVKVVAQVGLETMDAIEQYVQMKELGDE